jgi:hypothetical protein
VYEAHSPSTQLASYLGRRARHQGASAGEGRVDETHRQLRPTLMGTNERCTPAIWILARWKLVKPLSDTAD